jgi:nickel-dependent lactate racemase
MFIDMPYGKQRISVRIPDGVDVEFLSPRAVAPLEDIPAAFRGACENAIDSPSLASFVREAGRVVILVSDLTRGGGAKQILPICLQYLRDLNLPPERIHILIARGTHRKLTKEERSFFKTKDFSGISILEHDCDDGSGMSALVLTSRGTPVRINRQIKDADLVLLLAPVSFHYFAGFGGGRKLILPGCADRQSILANHRLSLLDSSPVKLNPLCKSGSLQKNPIHEDMCEALAALSGVFSVNFFGDSAGNVAFINAGSPERSHSEACEAYEHYYLVPVDEPYRLLVVSPGGFPYDINLLQSHKALKHASAAVVESGSVLLLAECAEGVGSEGFKKGFEMPKNKFLKIAYKEYEANYQTAVSLYGMLDKFSIGMVTKLTGETLDTFGMERCDNIEVFLAGALEKAGASKVGVVPYGNSTLAKIRQGGKS